MEQHAASREVQDPGAELVADPQIAVRIALQRFGVDVPTGEQAVGAVPVDDRVSELVVGISERDVVTDRYGTGSALCRLEMRTNVIRADEEVAGVVLCP